MKKTQYNFVKKQLLEKGQITRNQALQNYITRLSSIILTLKEEGFEIEGSFKKVKGGKDYVYTLQKSPYKKKEYWVNGTLVGFKYERALEGQISGN